MIANKGGLSDLRSLLLLLQLLRLRLVGLDELTHSQVEEHVLRSAGDAGAGDFAPES